MPSAHRPAKKYRRIRPRPLHRGGNATNTGMGMETSIGGRFSAVAGAAAGTSAVASSRWFSFSWSSLFFWLFIAGLFAYAGYWVYQTYHASTKTQYASNREHKYHDQNTNKTAQVLLFYATWCGACQQFKPEWDSAKLEMDGKVVNGYRIQFVEYDCSENAGDAAAKMKEYNIDGFPTVKLVHDGQVVTFSGDRTKDNIVTMLETNL